MTPSQDNLPKSITGAPVTPPPTRRSVLGLGLRIAALLAVVGGAISLFVRRAMAGQAAGKTDDRTVWQIDPYKCIQCGNCQTYCVLRQSAVKCVHAYDVCGYCRICWGYFHPQMTDLEPLTSAGENQVCPTGAISRTYIEFPYYEYTIDEPLCVGCGKCVKGCTAFGNGSLHLQVRHDRCVNCNDCAIARNCPTQAFRRVPASKPYLIKTRESK